MEEEWAQIEDWPKFKVSNYGNVLNAETGRFVKSSFHSRGYVGVNLERDGRRSYVPLARLVALAFVDGYFDGAEIRFKDNNRRNIAADNLEWVTHYQNNKWNSGRGGDILRQGVINQQTGEVEWDGPEVEPVIPRRVRRSHLLRKGVVNRDTGEVDWESV